ncbi:MAG: amidohydrolase family protein [Planctomycetes bacterium]|nr:amidohydrolase family protein [Planctomycetota bacterium]
MTNAANRLGLDYRDQAQRLGPPVIPITDVHTHINGKRASRIYAEAAELYGVDRLYSMSRIEDVPHLQDLFGDRIRFIAVPNYMGDDPKTAFTTDWLARIVQFAELGSRICKFWCAPRSRDYEIEIGIPDLFSLDGEWRKRALKLATECGMMFMVHIADPDTWFAGKYTDTATYGTKMSQYEPLERALSETPDTPWIAAHMGGNPEDLSFLDGLLSRHANLYLDTSATKWMVRELSAQPRDELVAFLTRWQGRIMFGSDIVSLDDHLGTHAVRPGMGELSTSREEAFDLYASRYWALRTLFETEYEGESPIADPDLHMCEPETYSPEDAPILRGKSLPADLRRSLYAEAAEGLLNAWHDTH